MTKIRFGEVSLSETQYHVLRLLHAGKKRAEIAKELHKSPRTVSNILSATEPSGVYHLIGVENETQAVSWFSERLLEQENAETVKLNPDISPLDMLEFSRHIRQVIRDARARFDIGKALNFAEFIHSLLQAQVSNAPTEAIREILAIEQAYVLLEQVNVYSDALSASEAWQEIRPLRAQQLAIVSHVKNPEIEAVACFTGQGLCYMVDHHIPALRFSTGIDDIIHDPHWKLAKRRVTAYNFANIGNKEQAYEEASKIKEMLDNSEIDDPLTILYGMDAIGRVRATFKDPTAFEFYDGAWQHYENIRQDQGRSLLREYQLLAHHLEAVVHIDPTNLSLIEQITVQGLNQHSDTEPEYTRHKLRIMDLLGGLLDGANHR